ncbi:MAG: hypothetical protein ACFFCS_14415 [Candidatus Hodarchaeota archaeon]
MKPEEIRQEAEKLGLTDLPTTVLYLSSKAPKRGYSFPLFDFISRFMKSELKDAETKDEKAHKGLARIFFGYAPNARMCIEIRDFPTSGMGSLIYHGSEVKVYCDDENKVRQLAKVLIGIAENSANEEMFGSKNWAKIEKKFKMSAEENKANWEKLLE